MKLRFKVTLSLLGTSALLTLALGVAISLVLRARLEQNATTEAQQKVQGLDQAVALFLEDKVEETTILSSFPEVAGARGGLTDYTKSTKAITPAAGHLLPKEASLFTLFSHYLDHDPSLQQIELGLADGGYLGAPLSERFAGYDPRIRPWYQGAVNSAVDPALLPARLTSSGRLVLPVTKEVTTPTGDLLGVLSVSIGLQEFSNLVGAVKPGAHGFVLARDHQGNLIAAPQDPALLLKTVANLSPGPLRDALGAIDHPPPPKPRRSAV